MRPISIFGLGVQSKSSNVTSQQRINMYLEIAADADKNTVTAYGTPGLTLFSDLGATPVRGLHTLGAYVYAIHGGTLYRIDSAGVATSKGTLLTSTGRVSMADNGAEIIIVDGANGYIYNVAADTLARITHADFPGADTVTFNDGYFVVNKPGTGQFYLSGSYDGMTWDALDFATAESNPDNLIACIADHGELILLGDIATEFWTNTGGSDFPYSRINGAAVEWGLAARDSVARFDNSLIWLAKNRMGEVQVVRLNGYNPTRVSTFDIEAIFNGYSDIEDATGFSYLFDGHPFYQVNFNEASWLYDGASNAWSQLKSHGIDRQLSDMAIQYQLSTLTADYATGKIYRVSGDNYTENGSPLVAELVTKHVFANLERYSISELQVDLESGVGLATGQGSDPQIMLQVSKDGGKTWGAERWADMGKIGEHKTRAKWNRLGQARNWTFRLKISDPVKRVVLGAYVTGA